MSNKHSSSDIFNSAPGEVRSYQLKQFLNKMLFHWPLYVICFMVSMGIAGFYLRNAHPVYDIHAKVLIKDGQTNSKAALKELDLENPENVKDIQADIGLMNSIPVTEQVVTDLQLWVTYKEPTKYYSYRDIYSKTPVQFKLIKAGRSFSNDHVDIVIESEDYFLLKHPDDTTTERFSFKNNYVSSFGTWKLDTTKNLKEYIGKTIRIDLQNPKNVVKYYQDAITETVILKSSDLDIAINEEVPERGVAILNDLLRVYMDFSIQQKRESTQNTLKFVDQRLVAITQELNNVESQYQGYKSNRGITDPADQSSRYFGNVQSNERQIDDINIKLSVIDGIERYINSNAGAENPPATIGMDDPGLLGLIRQLTSLQLERTKLLATLPESNPLFNPINQQISSVRTALRENIKGVKASLLMTKAQMQRTGSEFQSSIRNVPVQDRELNDIKRMQLIKEGLYTYLLQKKEALGLDYASTISDALIIDEAHVGARISPIPRSAYGIAFLIGFLIPTGLLYGRNAIKNRILSKNEITASTGMPVISEIVYEENEDAVVVLNQYSFIGEQFRDLRTKLNYLHGTSERGRITLFTSSVAGEGKSFILRNVGSVLSFAGKKTILIELDLRRPTFAARFNLDKTKLGLTDFLIGNATREEIIQPLFFSDNLFVITSGNIPPNPSELLESDQLSMLLKDLRLEYDHILIDTPPIHLLTDAMIVAPLCDVSLYVIRQDFTPKQELEFIRELHIERKIPKMNIIFNAVKNSEYGSGYRYNYPKNSYVKKTPVNLKNQIKKFFSRF